MKSAEILHGVKEIRNILRTRKRKKDNWTGHILYTNCFLKHVIERKIEGTRRGRRLKKLFLKESEDTVSSKRKRQLALSGEPALRTVMD